MHGERQTILALFAQTEVFIYIFVEIMLNLQPVQRVILKIANWRDKTIFILLFGSFSIMGTALGIPLKDGIIANIRDIAPMLAGLTAGPLVGLCVGLIGAAHRLTMGGITDVSCSLATVISGLLSGYVNHLNKGKMIGILPAMVFAMLMELLHGAITLLIARPFADAWEGTKIAIPAMIIASSLGVAIGVIIISKDIRDHEIHQKLK